MHSLNNSEVCISLLTPNSIYRPWVYFESGGSYALSIRDQDHFRMFPVCAYGLNKGELNGPFAFIQARNLNNKNEVLLLCQEVGKIFEKHSYKPTNEKVDILCKESSKGTSSWGIVHQTLVCERMDSSPFSIQNLLFNTEKHIFIAGQTLYFLTTNESIRNQLFNWIMEKDDRLIQILFCNSKEVEAVKAWQVVGVHYSKDLDRSMKIFKNWHQEIVKKKIERRFDIRVTKLVTTTINIIDPDLATGKLVLIPVVFGKSIGAERPHFIISKKESKEVFSHYWETYIDTFNRATKIENT
jgi:hypothetical protein